MTINDSSSKLLNIISIFTLSLIFIGAIISTYSKELAFFILHVTSFFFPALIIADAVKRYGVGTTIKLFLLSSIIGTVMEISGVLYGFPFGKYTYTSVMRFKIAGLVPLSIPIYWFVITYVSMHVTNRITRVRYMENILTAIILSIIDGLCAVSWDLIMDPVMVNIVNAWVWESKNGLFGVPFSNYVGWVFVASLMTFGYRIIVFRYEINEVKSFLSGIIYVQLWLVMAIIAIINSHIEYVYTSLFLFLTFTLLYLINIIKDNLREN